ncbi:putative tyrosine-protein kinase AmsA [Geobacter sp. OR-1]|uniref:XrtA system polysaccharide chain length determinant n=1 Tax=Geobacter sp. OR-1 TaxID=1266765 RepID=UPI00054230E8|nr:XrtA system polysaccharide chain length determinant [Geobacter sp. OR-1]GAM10601.1 putative tyrosine-protein kinase AmsA [Geobacter sp. OR-1]
MNNNEFDYRKYLDLLLRRKLLFIIVALLIMSGGVIFSYSLPKIYEAKSTVFIEKNVISELVKGIAVTPSMEQTIKVLTYALTSRTILVKVINELDMNVKKHTDAELESILARVNKNISVKVRDNNLFMITYKDTDPKIARDFINTLVRTYIEQNVSSKREESYGAIQFLSDQIGTVKEKLDKADEELNQFKAQQGGVVNIDEAKLFQEINFAEQKLQDIQLRRRHLEGLKPVTRRESDPSQIQLQILQKRENELKTQFNDNYPELIRIRGEIDSLKQQISKGPVSGGGSADPQEVAKIGAELDALKLAENSLRRYIATNQALLRKIPMVKAELEKKDVDKRKQKELYDQLLSRQGQSEVSKQMEVQDKTTTFRIVDPAVLPVKPVSPNRVRIILMGILAGIACSFGLIVGLDQLSNSIKSVDGLKPFGLPVLAVIPRIPDATSEMKRQKKDRFIYLGASCYFVVILCFLGVEILDLQYVDKVITRINSLF